LIKDTRAMKLSNHRSLLLATASLALIARAFGAPSVRTITDVWGGTSNGNIAQGCTTFGPIPDLSAFFNGSGFRTLGGNTASGFTGVTSDQTATSGALLVNQVLPPVSIDSSGSSFGGGRRGARVVQLARRQRAGRSHGQHQRHQCLGRHRGGLLPGYADGNEPADRTQCGRLGALTGALGTFSAIDGSASSWAPGRRAWRARARSAAPSTCRSSATWTCRWSGATRGT